MDLPWIYLGFTLDLPWIYLGFTLDLPWIYLGFTSKLHINTLSIYQIKITI